MFTEAAFFFGECLERGLKILCRFLRAVLGEVEFGPEQVIGRINNISWDDDMMIGTTPIPLNDDIWRRAAEEQY